MTALFRSFIVWLMLLALPFQGYAAASMMLCAPAAPAPLMEMGQPGHDHAAMMAAMHGDHARAYAAQPGDGGQHAAAHGDHVGVSAAQVDGGAQLAMHGGHAAKTAHGAIKCGGAAACCVGAALAPDCALALPALALPSAPVSFYSDTIPAVHLAHPERPPQAARI
ncbi:hypothetical protein ACLB1G_06075 [Oxalobacteraceae bacterium A2-2]